MYLLELYMLVVLQKWGLQRVRKGGGPLWGVQWGDTLLQGTVASGISKEYKRRRGTRNRSITWEQHVCPLCHKLHSDVSPWIMGLFQQSKLHWKALKKTFPMTLGSPQHLKNPPRDQPISSHWTLNCLYLRNRWLCAFAFDCIIKLSSRQSHRLWIEHEALSTHRDRLSSML